MDDDKSNLEGRSNVAEDLSNTAANSSSREANETPANRHDGVEHLPPPPSYSEAIASTTNPGTNQPGMHHPVQQQGYPPMYPGGPQQPQFELGGFTPQGGTLNPDEIPQRIESSVITENNVVQRSWRPCLIRLFISFMFVGILVLIILGIRYLTV